MAKKLIIVGDYWSMGDVLGRGSYGIVYYGYHRKSKVPVAIKTMDLELLNAANNPKLKTHLRNEITIMLKINNSNVVRLYDFKQENKMIYLVMEYCPAGTFEKYLYKQPKHRISEADAKYFMRQFANGLASIRSLNAIHRDLKPENLLLSYAEDKRLILKLADFGFARFVETKEVDDPDDTFKYTLCGTPKYYSPEIAAGRKYSVKTDLWSVGVILYEMMYGRVPFHTCTTMDELRYCLLHEPIIYPNDVPVSLECKSIMDGLLQRDPNLRFSWDQFFSHPFIDLKFDLPNADNNVNSNNNNNNNNVNNNNENENKIEKKENQPPQPKPIDPEAVRLMEERLTEQLHHVRLAKSLADELGGIDKFQCDALSLYCKCLFTLQMMLSSSNDTILSLPSDPLFSSFIEKMKDIRIHFETILLAAENLSQTTSPSANVEKFMFSIAIERAQTALQKEIDSYEEAIHNYSLSLSLFSLLKLDAIEENDVKQLDTLIEQVKSRRDNLEYNFGKKNLHDM